MPKEVRDLPKSANVPTSIPDAKENLLGRLPEEVRDPPKSVNLPASVSGARQALLARLPEEIVEASEEVQRWGKNKREEVQRWGKDKREGAQRWGKDTREDLQIWGNELRKKPRDLMYLPDDLADFAHDHGMNPSVAEIVGIDDDDEISPRLSDALNPGMYGDKMYRYGRSETKKKHNRVLLPPTPREVADKLGSHFASEVDPPTRTINQRSWPSNRVDRGTAMEKQEQPDGRSCGPTSASILLKHYGIDASISNLKKRAWTDENGLTMPSALENAIEKYNLPMKRRDDMNIRNVVSMIDAGRLPILLVKSGRNLAWHYVIATGFNPVTRQIQIVSPSQVETEAEWYDADVVDRAWRGDGDLDGNRFDDPISTDIFVKAAGVKERTILVPERAP